MAGEGGDVGREGGYVLEGRLELDGYSESLCGFVSDSGAV